MVCHSLRRVQVATVHPQQETRPRREPHRPPCRFGSNNVATVTDEEQRWRDWADDKLVKLVTVNIYRNWAEAYQAMDYVKYVQSFSFLQQTAAYYFGGAVMYFVGTKLVPKYGLEGKDLRQELRLAVDSYIGACAFVPFGGHSITH